MGAILHLGHGSVGRVACFTGRPSLDARRRRQ